MSLENIQWVICGGESGPHAREVNISWVRGIRDMTVNQNIPFLFKQWGGINKKKTGCISLLFCV